MYSCYNFNVELCAQAEKKGATAAEYGLVFGVFELVVFIISPIYGQNVSTKLGTLVTSKQQSSVLS